LRRRDRRESVVAVVIAEQVPANATKADATAAHLEPVAADVFGVPAIDRSVAKGLMPLNKAARHKSRLNAHVKNL